MSCLPLTLQAGQKVRKAVIPAAGFGTRLFPASKATKKELFPIIDRDGIAKPVILLLVEEALSAGIEEVILIVQEHDLDDFRVFFQEQVTIENYNKLPGHFQEYARRILEIGRRVSFVTQTTQEGFGHAVYCARQAVGNEPFLLMLGDHLYRSATDVSCAQQLIAAYDQYRVSTLGLRSTPEAQLANFGTATGVWLEREPVAERQRICRKTDCGLCAQQPARAGASGGRIPDGFRAVHYQAGAFRLSGGAHQKQCARAGRISADFGAGSVAQGRRVSGFDRRRTALRHRPAGILSRYAARISSHRRCRAWDDSSRSCYWMPRVRSRCSRAGSSSCRTNSS